MKENERSKIQFKLMVLTSIIYLIIISLMISNRYEQGTVIIVLVVYIVSLFGIGVM